MLTTKIHINTKYAKQERETQKLSYPTNTTADICVRIIVHNYHTQHRTVLIIYPLNLQTNIIAQVLSLGQEVDY